MPDDKKLPHGWMMPPNVEALIGCLNEYGGTCYMEHAELIRAFFKQFAPSHEGTTQCAACPGCKYPEACINSARSSKAATPVERMKAIDSAYDGWLEKADPYNLFATSHGFGRYAWIDAHCGAGVAAPSSKAPIRRFRVSTKCGHTWAKVHYDAGKNSSPWPGESFYFLDSDGQRWRYDIPAIPNDATSDGRAD